MRKRITRKVIKESFDNLPSGICFFDANGLTVLCNRQMHQLVYALTGRDLQLQSDLMDVLAHMKGKDEDVILLSDGTAWQFRQSIVRAGAEYIQYVASNVTELYTQKSQLEKSTAEYAEMVDGIKKITENVVAISREEEILTLKMHIHNEVGICLQRLSRFITGDEYVREKDNIVSSIREITEMLRCEIGNDDEQPDPIGELLDVAESVGITILFDGALPEDEEAMLLLTHAIRECLTNVLRHAGGDTIWVALGYELGSMSVVITNNGEKPVKRIVEGGGLSSLRRRIEKSGGQMRVKSLPSFALRVKIPMRNEVTLHV